jgi:transcriptional regulator of acetoin/glycerol metabolism
VNPADSTGTTLPSESTRNGGETQSALAIRWLFPEVTGRLDVLVRSRTLLGRGDDCDSRLSGGEVSRHHAEIVRDGPLYIVRDLGSTNGVYLNGTKAEQARLSEHDIIRLGEWVGIVRTGTDDASAAPFGEIVPGMFGGESLRSLVELTRRAASCSLPVIIEGETGTGKELMSRAVHLWSNRPGPFIAVNCAALPESMAEAELFGYRKGAFTGAERPSLGHFRAAQGGTIQLDEIADMPLQLQAKVLRVLEQREVLPLGESTPVPVDIQVVAAAQQSLRHAVAEQRFRADLLARLNGLTLRLPPLRERREEIPFLFSRLLREHSGGLAPPVEAKLVERLCLYDWPFNVRELDLLVRRLLALHGDEPLLKRSHLPPEFDALGGSSEFPAASPGESEVTLSPKQRDRRDLEALLVALRTHHGNVARAATAINITRQRAYRLMEGRPDVRLEELRGEAPAAAPPDPATPKAGPDRP